MGKCSSEIAVGMGYELIDLELDESGLVRIFIDIVDKLVM